MKPNLDALKSEIEGHLAAQGMSIFYGYSRLMESLPLVFWDSEKYPDYRLFVKSAQAVGAKMMILNQRELSSDTLDDALEQLASSDVPSDEQRTIERRLKELRVYDGFTCSLEISFDHQGRVFMFDVQTEWYEELNNLLEDLEFLDERHDDGEQQEHGPIGNYFSKN